MTTIHCSSCDVDVPAAGFAGHLVRHDGRGTAPVEAVLYGLGWPRPWVRWRGRQRIARGLCPACSSSPPQPQCPICRGWHDYGPRLDGATRARWLALWRDWTAPRPRAPRGIS